MEASTRSEAFNEVEGDHSSEFHFQCDCGHVIRKRKDSFLVGAHMLTCSVCGNSSSVIILLDGSTEGIRTKDSAGRVG